MYFSSQCSIYWKRLLRVATTAKFDKQIQNIVSACDEATSEKFNCAAVKKSKDGPFIPNRRLCICAGEELDALARPNIGSNENALSSGIFSKRKIPNVRILTFIWVYSFRLI